MREFGGNALFLDRNDINTDEIIPAKYLTENTKMALQPHILEDLKLGGFSPATIRANNINVLVARANFGCGSSREHAVWVLEVNDINVVIAQGYSRIFRQNMFNCGMLAVELPRQEIDRLFTLGEGTTVAVDMEKELLTATNDGRSETFSFTLNPFDRELVLAGGWLAYADAKY